MNNTNKPTPILYFNQILTAIILSTVLLLISLVLVDEYRNNLTQLTQGFNLLKLIIGTLIFSIGILCTIKASLSQVSLSQTFIHFSIAVVGIAIFTNYIFIIFAIVGLFIAILAHDYFTKKLSYLNESSNEKNV